MNICKFIMKNRKIITVGIVSAIGVVLSTTSVIKATRNNRNTSVDADKILNVFDGVAGMSKTKTTANVTSGVGSEVINGGFDVVVNGIKNTDARMVTGIIGVGLSGALVASSLYSSKREGNPICTSVSANSIFDVVINDKKRVSLCISVITYSTANWILSYFGRVKQ